MNTRSREPRVPLIVPEGRLDIAVSMSLPNIAPFTEGRIRFVVPIGIIGRYLRPRMSLDIDRKYPTVNAVMQPFARAPMRTPARIDDHAAQHQFAGNGIVSNVKDLQVIALLVFGRDLGIGRSILRVKARKHI